MGQFSVDILVKAGLSHVVMHVYTPSFTVMGNVKAKKSLAMDSALVKCSYLFVMALALIKNLCLQLVHFSATVDAKIGQCLVMKNAFIHSFNAMVFAKTKTRHVMVNAFWIGKYLPATVLA